MASFSLTQNSLMAWALRSEVSNIYIINYALFLITIPFIHINTYKDDDDDDDDDDDTVVVKTQKDKRQLESQNSRDVLKRVCACSRKFGET